MKAFLFCGLIFLTLACNPVKGIAQDSSEEISTFILVRHTEKVKSTDSDPVLGKQGEVRAQRLAILFSETHIDHILSTDYIRTRNTVAPLLAQKNLELELYDPRDNEFGNQLLENYKGKTVLISGHSNTTPQLVNILLGEEKYAHLDESEHGMIFIVTVCGEERKDLVLYY